MKIRGYAIEPGADLRGAILSNADLRGANLSGASLRGADLRGANLSVAILRGAGLRGANLEEAGLRGADLEDADLCGADLYGADLSCADLSGVKGLPKAPVISDLDARILAAIKSEGNALEMRRWHTCATTHCRAGWAVVIAGEEGAILERKYGPSVAGALLYHAVGRTTVPDWHASNADALADIRRGASNG